MKQGGAFLKSGEQEWGETMKKGTRKLLRTAGLLSAAWAFAVKPGMRGKTVFRKQFGGYDYAHRGLYDKSAGIPENSLTAFARAVENGFGIELDIRLTKDNRLAVIHDSSLERLCGVKSRVEEMTFLQLKELHLQDTPERIPSLRQVLALVNGQVPLIIELKPEGGNGARLCEKARWVLEDYGGAFAVEAFDPRILLWFRRNRPQWLRGQLAWRQNRHGTWIHPLLDLSMRALLSNCLTQPDFIAYHVQDWNSPSLWLCRQLYRTPVVCWTVREEETFRKRRAEGALVIFEGFRPDA